MPLGQQNVARLTFVSKPSVGGASYNRPLETNIGIRPQRQSVSGAFALIFNPRQQKRAGNRDNRGGSYEAYASHRAQGRGGMSRCRVGSGGLYRRHGAASADANESS